MPLAQKQPHSTGRSVRELYRWEPRAFRGRTPVQRKTPSISRTASAAGFSFLRNQDLPPARSKRATVRIAAAYYLTIIYLYVNIRNVRRTVSCRLNSFPQLHSPTRPSNPRLTLRPRAVCNSLKTQRINQNEQAPKNERDANCPGRKHRILKAMQIAGGWGYPQPQKPEAAAPPRSTRRLPICMAWNSNWCPHPGRSSADVIAVTCKRRNPMYLTGHSNRRRPTVRTIRWTVLIVSDFPDRCRRQGTKPLPPGQSPFPPNYVPSGEHLYKQFCSACHGMDAKGKGPAAASP